MVASPFFVDIGCKEPLLDEVLNQRPGFGGNFRKTGNATTRSAGVGIDAGVPGNEAAAKERQPRDAIPWDRGVSVGRLQRALDCRLDRASDATEAAIFRDRHVAVAAMLDVKPLQGEGKQRQRILGAAHLDVGKERIDQSVLDFERPFRCLQPPCRTFDHLRVGPFRHRAKIEGHFAYAFEQFCFLQMRVGIGADGKHDDDRRRIGEQQVSQQLQQRLSLVLAVEID